jgi:hypothetical protein
VGSSGQDRVNISHLLFADDTLVFCGANASQIRLLGALLVCFEAAADLKVTYPNRFWFRLVMWRMWGSLLVCWVVGMKCL